MLNFEEIPQEEQLQLMQIIQKNIERSEVDRYYLFTENPIEKAKLFIWCWRFLSGVTNIVDRNLKLYKVLLEEVNRNRDLYIQVSKLIYNISSSNFNKSRNTSKLNNIVLTDVRVSEVLDAFAVLLERQNILSMSRLKGVVMEGQSAKEYKKIFSGSMGDMTQNLVAEEEIVEDVSEDEEGSEENEDGNLGNLGNLKEDESESSESESTENQEEDLLHGVQPHVVKPTVDEYGKKSDEDEFGMKIIKEEENEDEVKDETKDDEE